MKGLKFPAELPEHVTEVLASLDGERLERLYDFLKGKEKRIRNMGRNVRDLRIKAIRDQEAMIREAREDDPDLPQHDACFFDGSDKAMEHIIDWSHCVVFDISTGTIGCRELIFRTDPSSPVCPETLKRGNYIVCAPDFTFSQMSEETFAKYREGKELDVWRP